MATFIASSLVLWLVVSSQLGWAADKNAVSAATRDHQRSADLTMQALAAAVEPTEVLWLKTDDQPFFEPLSTGRRCRSNGHYFTA